MLPNPIIWNIHMYGIMVALGLLAAFIVLSVYCKRMKIGTKLSDFLYYNGIASILVGFGSAALFQATYDYIENPEKAEEMGQKAREKLKTMGADFGLEDYLSE